MFNPLNRIKTKTIQGKQYQIYLLPATEGIGMAKRLASTFLPFLGEFYENIANGSIDFQAMAVALVGELEDYDIISDVKRLLRETAVDGNEVDFDNYYMANYGELVEAVAFAIKENFSSFFAAKGLFANLMPKLKVEATQAE